MKRLILSASDNTRPELLVIGVLYAGQLIGFLTKGDCAQQDLGDTTKAHGPRYCTNLRSANAVMRNGWWNGRILDNRYTVGRFKSVTWPWESDSGRGVSWESLVTDEPLFNRSDVTYQVYSLDEAYNQTVLDLSDLPMDTLEDMYPGISKYSVFFNDFEKAFVDDLFDVQYSSLNDLLHACVPLVVDHINTVTGPRCMQNDRLDLQEDYLNNIPDEIYDEVVSKINPEFLK